MKRVCFDLKNKFLSALNVSPLDNQEYPKLFVIGFIGSIGSGKSTISGLLSSRLKLPILDNDGIRDFLKQNNYSDKNKFQDLVHDIARTRMRMYLTKKISYILDADLTITSIIDISKFTSYGAKLLLIKVDCPENINLERIKIRSGNEKQFLIDQQNFVNRQTARKKIQIDPESIFFTINSSVDLNPQIDLLIEKISNEILNL